MENGRNANRGGRVWVDDTGLRGERGKLSYILPDLECIYETVDVMGEACVDAGGPNFTHCVPYVKFSYDVKVCKNISDPDGTGPMPGGGTGVPPNNEIPEILDLLEDPCLKTALLKARSAEMMNEINDIIQRLDGSSKATVTIKETPNLTNSNGQTVYALHSNARFSDGSDVFYSEIELNSTIFANTSQEMIVSTIIHEILHAYFRSETGPTNVYGNFNNIHHNDMATKYVVPMIDFMRTLYPNLSRQSAGALVWEGLKGTTAFSHYQSNSSFPVGNNEIMDNQDYNFYLPRHQSYNINYGVGSSSCAN